MKPINLNLIIGLTIVLMTISLDTYGQFSPVPTGTYSINSRFTRYDITNKNASGVAEMGSKPYNQWQFEKVTNGRFRIKEVKTGKYLHNENNTLTVGDIQPNWASAQWEFEHINDNYYRIKNVWEVYGRHVYLQNTNRSLSAAPLIDENASYVQWRIRKDGDISQNNNNAVNNSQFSPESNGIYSINSPFTRYDITNKNASGVAEMGSKPYNQWQFEKVTDGRFRIKEAKTGKYLHNENNTLTVGDIQPNWASAQWEFEHVKDNYYRIKNVWQVYGRHVYLQNPNRSLSAAPLKDKNASYVQWRIRKNGDISEVKKIVTPKTPKKPTRAKPTFDGGDKMFGAMQNTDEEVSFVSTIKINGDYDLTGSYTILDMPPVHDEGQGREGSCGAWASAYAALSYEMYKTRGASYHTKNGYMNETAIASPEYLFNRVNSDDDDCRKGSVFVPTNKKERGLLSVMKTEGVPSWFEVPYSDKNGCTAPKDDGKTIVHPKAKENMINDYQIVKDISVMNIKRTLKAGKPILVGCRVTDKFMKSRGVYVWAEGVGGYNRGHAMVIVGYDDDLGAFQLQNSWGTNWGDGGYGWVAYDHLKNVLIENAGPYIINGSSIEHKTIEEESFVSVYCEAGYVINCQLSYEYNGELYKFDEDVSLWFSFRKKIPKGATNVYLEVNSILCIDHLQIKRSYNTDVIRDCYKVWGTIFDTEYKNVTCEY